MNNKPTITVGTITNGYEVIVNGKDFMYFTPEDLVIGLTHHASDNFAEQADLEIMRQMIADHNKFAKAYKEKCDKVMNKYILEIERLKKEIEKLKNEAI